MAAGQFVQPPAASTEGSTQIASGAASASIDTWLSYSFQLNYVVARQGVVLADPANPIAVTAIKAGNLAGNEYGPVVQLAPNGSDMQALLYAVQCAVAELRNISAQLNALPVTPDPFLPGVSQFQ